MCELVLELLQVNVARHGVEQFCVQVSWIFFAQHLSILQALVSSCLLDPQESRVDVSRFAETLAIDNP